MTKSHRTCFSPGRMFSRFAKIQRGDDLRRLQPLVDAELLANLVALEDDELLLELFLQFALPLESQVGGADDQHPLGESAQLQFPDEQARHDGLARTGVVGEQEADAGELQQVVIDGLKLVRQRVYAGDGQSEVGVELIGDAERVRLDADAEDLPVAVVSELGLLDLELGEVGSGEGDPSEFFGADAAETDHPCAGAALANRLHPHRLAEERAADDLPLNKRWRRLGWLRSRVRHCGPASLKVVPRQCGSGADFPRFGRALARDLVADCTSGCPVSHPNSRRISKEEDIECDMVNGLKFA